MSLMMPVRTVPSMMTRPIEEVVASPACTDSGLPPSRLSTAPASAVVQLVPFALASAPAMPNQLVLNTASPPVSSRAPDRTVMVLACFRSMLALIDWIGIALPAKVSVRAERS
ncbi:hypothetical protein CHKEEEPN_1503 [Methylorubrum podarium]|nr:hypothetical protein CHKEEEPN_1503 [Methylorubrum podarium]